MRKRSATQLLPDDRAHLDYGQAADVKIPGLYAALLAEAVEAVRQPDPRLKHVDYTPGLDAAGRRVTNSVSPVTRAATRRLEAGEPQLIAASSISFRQFPQAASISFLERKVFDTKEEDDAQAWLVRVYPDDRVEVGQTRGQMWEQVRLVGLGFIVGRIDDNGG